MADRVKQRVVEVTWAERALTSDELARVRMLAIEDVCDRTGFCRAHIYRMIDEDKFPRPIKFSPGRRGAVRWPDIWINDWLGNVINGQPREPQSGKEGSAHAT